MSRLALQVHSIGGLLDQSQYSEGGGGAERGDRDDVGRLCAVPRMDAAVCRPCCFQPCQPTVLGVNDGSKSRVDPSESWVG